MSWKDKISNLMYNPQPSDDYVDDYDPEQDEYAKQDPAQEAAPAAPAQSRSANQFNMSSGSSIEMKVVKPERLESVTQIADQLLARKTILLNLEETNKETSRRLIDFLNGVAYAISGTLKKVANNTYVITPSNVEVSGEQLHDAQAQEKTGESL